MSKKDNGGPAFPVAPTIIGPNGELSHAQFEGMSLRDWFAGMALCGIQSNPGNNEQKYDRDAELAYATADAMLAEREKP